MTNSKPRHDGLGTGIVVQESPARTRVAAASRAGKFPNHARVVQLKELVAAGYDCRRARIVIKHLPTGAGIPAARCTGKSPDLAAVM